MISRSNMWYLKTRSHYDAQISRSNRWDQLWRFYHSVDLCLFILLILNYDLLYQIFCKAENNGYFVYLYRGTTWAGWQISGMTVPSGRLATCQLAANFLHRLANLPAGKLPAGWQPAGNRFSYQPAGWQPLFNPAGSWRFYDALGHRQFFPLFCSFLTMMAGNFASWEAQNLFRLATSQLAVPKNFRLAGKFDEHTWPAGWQEKVNRPAGWQTLEDGPAGWQVRLAAYHMFFASWHWNDLRWP